MLGTLNIGGFFALLFMAAYRLPGGVAATLGAIQPLVAAGLAAWLLRERLSIRIVFAGLLGFAGVALLVLRAGARLDGIGVLAGLAGAVSMASGVVLTKYWGRPVPLLAFTSWQLIAGGLVLVPAALAVEGMPPHLTGQNLLGFLWLATGGTAVAYSLWFRGIERIPVSQASLLALMSPVVATAAGMADRAPDAEGPADHRRRAGAGRGVAGAAVPIYPPSRIAASIAAVGRHAAAGADLCDRQRCGGDRVRHRSLQIIACRQPCRQHAIERVAGAGRVANVDGGRRHLPDRLMSSATTSTPSPPCVTTTG